MNTSALVLGCNGFCAGPLSRILGNEDGVRVVGADLGDVPQVPLDTYHRLDITDPESLGALLEAEQPNWIFNLAGVATGAVDVVYRVNLMGAVHLLEAVRSKSPDSRIVLVGSAAEYGWVPKEANPLVEDRPCYPESVYGLSKHAMTQAALAWSRRYGLGVVVMRPFNLIGPGTPGHLVLGAVLKRAREAIRRGESTVRVGNVDAVRDFVAVDDAVRAYLLAAKSNLRGEVINVCSGRGTAVGEIVERLLSCASGPLRLEVDPALLKPVDVPVAIGDPSKALKLLGWHAGEIEPGLMSSIWLGK